MRRSIRIFLLFLCAALLTTCSEERKRALNNPTDPQSGNYVGHEVRDLNDPANAPIVQITSAPTRIKINVPFTYTATASDPNPSMMPDDQPGDVVRLDWDFGDGSTVSDGPVTIEHTYLKSVLSDTLRTFTVRVTAHDNHGNERTATQQVIVSNLHPNASTGATYYARPNYPVALNGTADDDGKIVRYEWDFDGDGVYDWSSNSNGQITHVYPSIGLFNPTFRATDDDGNSSVRVASVITYPNVWSAGPDMPTARSGVAAVAVDKKMYVIDGNSGYYWYKLMEIYDMTTGLWSTANMHSNDRPRTNFAAAVANGNIYIMGGYNGTGYSGYDKNVFVYDPWINRWNYCSDIPTPRIGLAAAAIDGKVYVVGGYKEYSTVSVLEIYDPLANTWTSGPDMPTARSELAAVAINGKLYVVGGEVGYQQLRTLEIYNPTTREWSAGPDMPTARKDLAAAVVDEKMYVVGGYGGSGKVEVYDPITNTWTRCTDMPTARFNLAAAAVDHKLFVVGGEAGSTSRRTLEILSW